VELDEWKPSLEYTRTGLDAQKLSILDVEIDYVQLPIFPGKNVTVITEVIALNYLLRHYGYDAAKEFAKRVERKIAEKKENRTVSYFEHDFE
jgi:HPr kinase/phosphorylase